MSHRGRHYIVGIDLGTTNTAVAYVAAEAPTPRVRVLPLLQLVSEGELAERSTLPSFYYIGGGPELPRSALAVPWDPDRRFAVGEFARVQGARVPGRLVSSAKSWLCHGGVDRDAPILPWGATAEVPKVSPVEVSAQYLKHVREVWNRQFPENPLEEQQVVLTVPASFDEVARELTWQAAQRAQLEHVVLLEEPQAALYAWLEAHGHECDRLLSASHRLLVVDVGGGTTDFTLVAVRLENDRLVLDRIAVGDHILLGGDNMDIALARAVEQLWGERLDTQRFFALIHQCRAAKEALLADDPPQAYSVALPGRGRGVIAGALSATLSRDNVLRILLEGFFPRVAADATPHENSGAALSEWGLPFAADPAVSRHLAAFLRRHLGTDPGGAWPDTILFNGGALKPSVLRQRITELLEYWSGQDVRVLDSVDLDLAVARGAAYYGLARRGRALRIGGGAARAYYVGLGGGRAGSDEQTVRALCVVQRGMEEGEERQLSDTSLVLVTNRAVTFPLFASSVRQGDAVGSIVELHRPEISALPPIRTVLRFGKKIEARELPVHLAVRLTEIGTLELWCVSRNTPHRWRLQFDLRDANLPDSNDPNAGAGLTLSQDQLLAATSLLRAVFPSKGPSQGDPVTVVRQLEDVLGCAKDAWPLPFLRQSWAVLWDGREARKQSPEHEARWYNLAGLFLRPGFGAHGDPLRLDQLWRLRSEGLRFAKAIQVRTECWNLWKRIAGGLQRAQQQQLFQELAPYLLPRLQRKRDKLPKVAPQETRLYWEVLAACELLTADQKGELGDTLLQRILRSKATAAEIWALGRLGARTPMYGPLNSVVPADKVAHWVIALLAVHGPGTAAIAFTLVQLARCTGDRERDLPGEVRERVAQWLESRATESTAARLVREPCQISSSERARILDETLPLGLIWSGSEGSDQLPSVGTRP